MEVGTGTGGTLQNGGLSRIQARPMVATQVTVDQHVRAPTSRPHSLTRKPVCHRPKSAPAGPELLSVPEAG